VPSVTDRTPVLPVDAATVILLREAPAADGGWELFMVRRHARSEFAADVFVFPGGKIDEADRRRLDSSWLDCEWPNDAPDEPAFRVGAIRELFEEAGVLLAAQSPAAAFRADALEAFRRRLRAGEIDLWEVARAAGLKLAVSALHPFARWITPEGMPRRYDTWFYLARFPVGQSPWHDEVETVDSLWITPREALRRAEVGDFPLVFVTEHHLRRMARYDSIDDLIGSVREGDFQSVTPRVVERAGELVFVLPGEPGY
jgi:8-oxo-dGTP pyrophosphatase MutT (NUDIX family)